MRLLPWLAIAISLAFASTANARHFWQTYGSTMPAADGCGCTWNWNSDYFVPRHPSTCRYGLFSPCKPSCTTSPACKWCHPFYPGYCSIYGPCHYHRRNHVYDCRCGCSPIHVTLKRSCSNKACACTGSAACGGSCTAAGCTSNMCCAADGCGGTDLDCSASNGALYNVEQPGFQTLGSIPVDSSQLLTRTDLSQIGAGGDQLLQPKGLLEQLPGVPSLRGLTSPQLSQPALNIAE